MTRNGDTKCRAQRQSSPQEPFGQYGSKNDGSSNLVCSDTKSERVAARVGEDCNSHVGVPASARLVANAHEQHHPHWQLSQQRVGLKVRVVGTGGERDVVISW